MTGPIQPSVTPASRPVVNRRTGQLLAGAGFDVTEVADERLISTLVPAMPHIRGRIPMR